MNPSGVQFAAIAAGLRKDLEPLGFRVHVNTNKRSITITPKIPTKGGAVSVGLEEDERHAS